MAIRDELLGAAGRRVAREVELLQRPKATTTAGRDGTELLDAAICDPVANERELLQSGAPAEPPA